MFSANSRHLRIALLLLLLVPLPAFAQAPRSGTTRKNLVANSMIDIEGDASFRAVVSNPTVRAFRLELKPATSTQLDRHDHDYLVLAVTPAILRVANDLRGYDLHLDHDEMQVIKGGWAHRISNEGEAPATLVVVECSGNMQPERARCGLGAPACGDGRFASNENGQYTSSTLFETPAVRLGKVTLGPGSMLAAHSHDFPHLMIALTELKLVNVTAEGSSEWTQQPGGAAWFDAGLNHALKNESAREARFLLLELKNTSGIAAK